MTALGSVRAPAFLSRSLVLSNPTHHLSQNIRRSLDPYKIQTKSMHSSSRMGFSAPSSAIPHISLHIAASSSGKGRKFRPEANTYDYEPSNTNALGLQRGSNMKEKRANRPDSGQDAYFVTRVGRDSNVTAFAVADGVGGWTEHGIDPADFSHGLCSHMADTALNWSGDKLGPKQLLDQGYQKAINDPDILAGGTTACVAVTDEDGRMRIANLGDSGFLLLRLGTVHHYSDPQTHAFNTPYQMSLTPPSILAQAKVFGGIPLDDKPEKADLADHMLRHGDVLVLATDGVWDNLDSQDVLNIVGRVMRESGAWQRDPDKGYIVGDRIQDLTNQSKGLKGPKTLPGTLQAVLAANIVGEAKTASLNQKRDGPFAKAVQREYPGESFHGGKVDDISALVIVSVDNNWLREKQVKAKL